MEKIVDILETLSHEKGINPKDTREALQNALVRTATRVIDPHAQFEAAFDDDKKKIRLFKKLTVIEDADPRGFDDPENFVFLDIAKEFDPEAEIGDGVREEIDFNEYGRTVAMTLHFEFERDIQKLVETQVFNKYKNKINQVISGVVSRVDGEQTTYIEIDEIKAFLPQKNRIKNESFKSGQTVKAIVKNINFDKSRGITMELSRTSPKFLEELLRLEVPEIRDELVILHKCARIPGKRAKVAVSTDNPKIDPIGATVGVKGVRINAVSREIGHECIDIVEFSEIPELFLSRAMSPAIVKHVVINDKKATITIPNGEKAKAIGKEGYNIRLCSMLTGYEIELIELEGMKIESSDNNEPLEPQNNINALAALFK